MELTTAVRKELAMALKDLLQHGLIEVMAVRLLLEKYKAEEFTLCCQSVHQTFCETLRSTFCYFSQNIPEN